jgi:hypothetical protein
MNKQFPNTFYDQRKVYLIITNYIKWYKTFYIFRKTLLVIKGKCLIHNKYMNSNF